MSLDTEEACVLREVVKYLRSVDYDLKGVTYKTGVLAALADRLSVQPIRVFTLWGAPTTKKTSNRLVRAGRRYRVLPSKTYAQWAGRMTQAIDLWRCRSGVTTLTAPVQVTATFYRPFNTTGDLCGYMQALGDLLQLAGVIDNDRLIASWDGSRLAIDRDHPRIEVAIALMPTAP